MPWICAATGLFLWIPGNCHVISGEYEARARIKAMFALTPLVTSGVWYGSRPHVLPCNVMW
jgi:hypothetical protein